MGKVWVWEERKREGGGGGQRDARRRPHADSRTHLYIKHKHTQQNYHSRTFTHPQKTYLFSKKCAHHSFIHITPSNNRYTSRDTETDTEKSPSRSPPFYTRRSLAVACLFVNCHACSVSEMVRIVPSARVGVSSFVRGNGRP